jgi:hypothetical protein
MMSCSASGSLPSICARFSGTFARELGRAPAYETFYQDWNRRMAARIWPSLESIS